MNIIDCRCSYCSNGEVQQVLGGFTSTHTCAVCGGSGMREVSIKTMSLGEIKVDVPAKDIDTLDVPAKRKYTKKTQTEVVENGWR